MIRMTGLIKCEHVTLRTSLYCTVFSNLCFSPPTFEHLVQGRTDFTQAAFVLVASEFPRYSNTARSSKDVPFPKVVLHVAPRGSAISVLVRKQPQAWNSKLLE